MQGWVQTKDRKSFNQMKRFFGENHFELCFGSEYDNDKYCTKDNKYIKIGKFITQGARTDLEAVKNDIQAGKSLKYIADNYFSAWVRYKNSFKEYKMMCDQEKRKLDRKINVEYVYGKTGTGKTHYAVNKTKDSFKIEGGSLNWWDGYNGEKTLIIDEYNNDVPVTKMLNLLDKYTLRLDVKNSFTYANWENVIITSNLTPEQLHENCKFEHKQALLRRINTITHLKNPEVSKGNTITLDSKFTLITDILTDSDFDEEMMDE